MGKYRLLVSFSDRLQLLLGNISGWCRNVWHGRSLFNHSISCIYDHRLGKSCLCQWFILVRFDMYTDRHTPHWLNLYLVKSSHNFDHTWLERCSFSIERTYFKSLIQDAQEKDALPQRTDDSRQSRRLSVIGRFHERSALIRRSVRNLAPKTLAARYRELPIVYQRYFSLQFHLFLLSWLCIFTRRTWYDPTNTTSFWRRTTF